jgi:hypothetical protein
VTRVATGSDCMVTDAETFAAISPQLQASFVPATTGDYALRLV